MMGKDVGLGGYQTYGGGSGLEYRENSRARDERSRLWEDSGIWG